MRDQVATFFIPMSKTGLVTARRLVRHLLNAAGNCHRCMGRNFVSAFQALIKQIECIGRTIIEMPAVLLAIQRVFVLLPVRIGQANGNHEAMLRHWDDRRPLHERSGDHWPSNTNAMPSAQYRPLATERQARWSIFAMTRSL